MNKKQRLNLLKADAIEKLTTAKKKELYTDLNKIDKLSERAIGGIFNKPQSTIHDIISGRQKNVAGSFHISIDKMIEHFKKYEPNRADIPKLKKLKEVIESLLMKEIQYKD